MIPSLVISLETHSLTHKRFLSEAGTSSEENHDKETLWLYLFSSYYLIDCTCFSNQSFFETENCISKNDMPAPITMIIILQPYKSLMMAVIMGKAAMNFIKMILWGWWWRLYITDTSNFFRRIPTILHWKIW